MASVEKMNGIRNGMRNLSLEMSSDYEKVLNSFNDEQIEDIFMCVSGVEDSMNQLDALTSLLEETLDEE